MVSPVETLRLRLDATVFGNAEKFTVGALGGQNGDLLLTSHRLIAIRDKGNVGEAVGGLVGGLIAAAIADKYEFLFEIPLANIIGVEDDKIGLYKAILVRTNDGQAYKIKVPKREKEQWVQLLTHR